MAIINQSPAGQATATLDIDVDLIDARGTPSRRNVKTVGDTTRVYILPKATALLGGLLGQSVATTSRAAPGMWKLTEQIAAKRLGAWP